MAIVLSFVPHKSTKTPQNKRFIDFPSFFTGQNSTFAAAKQCSAKDLIGSKVFLDIIFSGFVPFLSRLRNIGERQKLEVIENKRVTIDKIGRNAVTTSNHQNCPRPFDFQWSSRTLAPRRTDLSQLSVWRDQ